ncbi:uncharacterized protein LOC110278775 [Arachis duranensis]|uniref:Uncharacterized protein LOC110278775 n=1 Tax=Arachis duranensis TaxID=130453 RepID=A0A6P5N8B2_ARADU|nr:uncharacterized protein LOC110278775 [Arachis duranensis]
MKLLSWNCQGLGRPLTIHNLKRICKSYSPEVGFICETKNQSRQVEGKLRSCGFKEWFIVDPDGLLGGLAMAWRDGCTVQILQHGRFFIAASVLTAGSNDPYGVLGVYLSSNDQHRMAQFAELTSVTQQFDGKVVLMGDFNAISNQLEKEGGGAKSPFSIETFNSFIDDNFLIDIGMVGRPFTWSNRRRGDELIQERLDRFLVGVDWQQLYPNATVLRLSESGSDHAPLLLDSNLRTERSKHRFKFQERWCSNDEIRQIVKEVWHEQIDGSAMYILAQKIKRCRHKIVKWQQEHRSNSKVEIDLLQSELEELRLAGIHGGDIISEIEDKLEKALQNEESYWKDKSRVKWLKYGDQNTAFFHQKFRNRTRRNRIWQLTGNDGEVATSNAGIASVAESYFKDIFSSTCHENLEPLFTDFEPKVTAHMNRRLQRPVTMEEVKRATFSIHPQSAPGDDVKSFFSGGRILKSFNHTQICLIPKISYAKDMTQIMWIRELVTTVSYSVIVEGQPYGFFKPNREILNPLKNADRNPQLLAIICWNCWKARNQLIFESSTSMPSAIPASSIKLFREMQKTPNLGRHLHEASS